MEGSGISKDLDDIDINLLAGPTNTNLGGEDAIDINDMPQGTWGW